MYNELSSAGYITYIAYRNGFSFYKAQVVVQVREGEAERVATLITDCCD